MKTSKRTILIFTVLFALSAVSAFASDPVNTEQTNYKLSSLKVLSKAHNIAVHMNDGVNKYQTLENLSIAYAQLKDFDKALKIANSIESSTNKVNALLWIARHYSVDGQKEIGSNLLSQSLKEAFNMENTMLKVDIFKTLAAEYEKYGLVSQSRGISKQADILAGILAGTTTSQGNN
ncbi:MAG: hypothetical protein GY863_01600 [bacterium]|nr:hypothetical protein [bacterium]